MGQEKPLGKVRKHTVTLTFTLLHEPHHKVEAAAAEVTHAVAAALEAVLPRIVNDAMQDRRAVFEAHTLAGRHQVKVAEPVNVDGRELSALQVRLVRKQ